jgi:hypothetical protein
VPPSFPLVYVVCQRIRPHAASETRGRHLRQRRWTTVRGLCGRLGDSPSTAVPGDAEYGRPGGGREVGEQRGDEELGRGRITAGVRDPFGGSDEGTAIEF